MPEGDGEAARDVAEGCDGVEGDYEGWGVLSGGFGEGRVGELVEGSDEGLAGNGCVRFHLPFPSPLEGLEKRY